MAVRDALAFGILLIGGTLLVTKRASASLPPDHPLDIMPIWNPPPGSQIYVFDIYTAEDRHGIPRSLLMRLLYQESRFRADIISGELVSSAGAVGIAQIVPRWHPNAKPLDPIHSIFYAAGYLKDLHDMFGSWKLALAAYNWGPGNVKRAGLEGAPDETLQYVAQITADVPVA